ncbi:hypothetical protein LHGZ1_1964 [Laribacter hongkongensis]|uniref:Uncharacterized protein n=1 Tax=Laribacter hongkongensis TaxID=168471 RepID=A0A248LJS5_9NEIS|nr:hypothetical protein LHGZ1_1964 [Laribacter hongkongensis]
MQAKSRQVSGEGMLHVARQHARPSLHAHPLHRECSSRCAASQMECTS